MTQLERFQDGNDYISEQAKVDDIAGLLAIEREAFPEGEAWSEAAFLKELELRNKGLMVVRDGDKVVGYVQAQVGYDDILDRQDRDPADGVIGSLAVLKEYRGRGIGEHLLRAAVDYLEGKGVPRVVASVHASNSGMLRLCSRAGFKTIGITPSFYNNGEDAVDMELVNK